MKFIKSVCFILLLCLFILVAGCFQETESDSYNPGYLIVVFNDSITRDEADSILKEYSLKWRGEPSFPTPSYRLWVNYSGFRFNDIDNIKEELYEELETKEKEMFEQQITQNRPLEEDPYTLMYGSRLIIEFKGDTSESDIHDYINSFPGFKIIELRYIDLTHLLMRWGTVKVKVGKEDYWIKKLEEDNRIKSAEVSSILYAH